MNFVDGYKEIGCYLQPVEDQVKTLQGFFPQLRSANLEIAKKLPPDGADGWIAIPRPECLGNTYIDQLFAIFSKSPLSCIDIIQKLRENNARRSASTLSGLKHLSAHQKGCDILIMPAQFGAQKKFSCIDAANSWTLKKNEFWFGVYEMAALLATHTIKFFMPSKFPDYFLLRGDEVRLSKWYAFDHSFVLHQNHEFEGTPGAQYAYWKGARERDYKGSSYAPNAPEEISKLHTTTISAAPIENYDPHARWVDGYEKNRRPRNIFQTPTGFVV